MQAEKRQKTLEEYILKREFVSLEELARQVKASVSTVRRDITQLEAAGRIRRTHGGARLITPPSDEFTFSSRDVVQLAEKEAIGRVCASLLRSGMTVIMDAGTTVYHAAHYISDQALQVVTNSLPVANHFASFQQIEVVVSGGVIYPRLGVLVGPLAVEAFSKINANVAIMGCGGITPEGVTNSHALLIDIQKAMLRAAGKVIFCLDHTKLGRKSVAQLCDLSLIDTVVTDGATPVELLTALRAAQVEVLIAEPTSLPQAEPLPRPAPSASSTLKTPRRAHSPPAEPESAVESSDSRMRYD